MLNRVIEEGAYADMLLVDVNPLDQRPKAGNLA
jgi:imidazolonepropionase-like amidohydrolase